MTAKNASLERTGSHHISDDISSQNVDGIGREEVYCYFSATWRGADVRVEMSADRYAHSSGMSHWRIYARAARHYDANAPGGRGADLTSTARSALGKLCEPFVVEWLESDAYTASFQTALGRMILRKFRDDYSAERRVTEALATFRDRLPRGTCLALTDALNAYKAFQAAMAQAQRVIDPA